MKVFNRATLRQLGTKVFYVWLFCAPLTAQEPEHLDILPLTSFGQDVAGLGWYVQNDNVMGGKSEGGFRIISSELVFSGNTNTDGGGFSSIRSQPLKLDLAGYAGIRLTLKADGRRYTWALQTDASWRGRQISYWADFDTVPGKINVIDVPFDNFFPQFRGYKLDGPELNTSKIRGFALYQYDKTDGPFELRLISVDAYSAVQ